MAKKSSDVEKVKEYLQKLADREVWGDIEPVEDLNYYDLSGGNFDDAYYGGCETGETQLAREILAMLTPTL